MKLLLVEDDPTSALLVTALARSLGHAVVHAADAEDALAELDLHPDIDAVLGDWHLPDRTGPELCRIIQERSARFVPFIYTSADDDRRRQLDGMRAGAIGYLIKPIDRHDLEMQLLAAERMLVLHRELAAHRAQLEASVARLAIEARHDAVLNIPNRASLDDEGPAFHAQAAASGAPYAAVMIDIDAFKAYNDHAGHLAGDAMLRRVADALTSELRGSDRLYRYGGDELVLLLPTPDADAAARVVERLRARVSACQLPHPATPRGAVTLSAGIAMYEPRFAADEPFPGVLDRADRALYRAKAAGRDRVATAPDVAVVGRATADDLPHCFAVRTEVFTAGQGVPAEIERDGRDDEAVHVVARVRGAVVGTARLRAVHGAAKAERVAVLAAFRGHGVGAGLMAALERIAAAQHADELALHAQAAVVPFYERLGYAPVGAPFVEANIPHQAMAKRLPPDAP